MPTLEKNLAAEIERNITNDSDFTQYLTAPSLTKCKFRCVTQAEVVQAVDKLENKNSFGHDGISNKLLKFVKDEIISSLTLIVNQMITTGKFPDSFNKSKIIPLFKKGEPSLLVNCRPISPLPTISKIFEKIIHNKMHDYFNDNNLLQWVTLVHSKILHLQKRKFEFQQKCGTYFLFQCHMCEFNFFVQRI